MQMEKHWKYETVNDANLSMHDRHITDIRFENQQLFLSLDSLCMLPGHPANPTDSVIRTGPAEICLYPMEQATLIEHITRCFTLFSHRLSPAWGQTWRCVTTDDARDFSHMVSHVVSMQPKIYEELFSADGELRSLTCDLMNVQGAWRTFLTLAKLEKQKCWHVFLGGKSFERFEKKHWEDEFDVKELSYHHEHSLMLRLEPTCSQSPQVTYRWDEIHPE